MTRSNAGVPWQVQCERHLKRAHEHFDQFPHWGGQWSAQYLYEGLEAVKKAQQIHADNVGNSQGLGQQHISPEAREIQVNIQKATQRYVDLLVKMETDM